MSIANIAVQVATLVAGLGIGALTVHVIVTHEAPPPQVTQPVPVDENRLADLVAARIIEADNTREAAERARLAAETARHKKADCAFWGKRGMEGCS